jgi:hypothetical protein
MLKSAPFIHHPMAAETVCTDLLKVGHRLGAHVPGMRISFSRPSTHRELYWANIHSTHCSDISTSGSSSEEQPTPNDARRLGESSSRLRIYGNPPARGAHLLLKGYTEAVGHSANVLMRCRVPHKVDRLPDALRHCRGGREHLRRPRSREGNLQGSRLKPSWTEAACPP